MTMQRRDLIKAGAVAALASATGFPAIAQARTKVKVGYLHTPAVDSHIFIGEQMGSFGKQGLDLELIRFTTGLELFQAMIGGSLDMLSTGAVLSNFPARGQGKAFLMNNIEYATAQLWVRDDSIKTIADLKGKQISTTTGTTAHVFLDRALRSANLDPAKDVQLVNQRMTEAVTSFISGAVPAVALVGAVRFGRSGRRCRAHASWSTHRRSSRRPPSWAAGPRATTISTRTARCSTKVIAGWAEANAQIIGKPDEAAEMLQKTQYKEVPLADFKEQFKASKYYSNADWRTRYQDGTVNKWLQQVTDFFVANANIQNALKAEQYFDAKLYLETVKG